MKYKQRSSFMMKLLEAIGDSNSYIEENQKVLKGCLYLSKMRGMFRMWVNTLGVNLPSSSQSTYHLLKPKVMHGRVCIYKINS